MLIARGRAAVLKSSGPSSHGIEPAPIAKNIKYTYTITMDKYLANSLYS